MNKLLQSLSALGVSASLVSPNLCVEATTNDSPSIKGTHDEVVKLGDAYNPLHGVFAFDKEDGDLTDKITVNGHIDTSKQGVYQLQYQVTDSDGMTGKTSRTVQVVDAPRNLSQSDS
ncbi:immunoglobulin-like domain-containing protein [Staphylococcus lutrae]|uniref:DUF5011 domain-containing protein n=1 Tax=Staphylococcus lutrae TaxID=155085 RepID=A0AAC9RPE6_9STAP|nr:immunoglobulin-like domain-containing protein [Staphylococcus lutrae]ARJ51503.1 DUF5011 domain-containing protein [Staphylococcus lutrae]PNZ39260.1 DUF5011 domain-containing protein [Staphylococcus lutrae]